MSVSTFDHYTNYETMKAWQVSKTGNFEYFTMAEVSSPPLLADEVQIRVHTAGINFADYMQVMGTHQNPPPLPFSPGFEVAGSVTQTNTSSFAIGDRVMATVEYGAYQEYVSVSERLVAKLPDEMSFETGAAIPVANGTAFIALTHRAALQTGETLAVFGASGNVGSRVVAIGAALGARVIVTYGDESEKEHLQALGASAFIHYKKEAVVDKIREMTHGQGANVIADIVGGDLFASALQSIAWEGRILPIGAASGIVPDLSAFEMIRYNASLVGTDYAAYINRQLEVIQEAFQQVFKLYQEEKLTFSEPDHVFSFEETAQVLQQTGEGKLKGKSVIRLI